MIDEPLTINRLTIAGRVFKTATTETPADGRMTPAPPEQARLDAERAAGGRARSATPTCASTSRSPPPGRR